MNENTRNTSQGLGEWIGWLTTPFRKVHQKNIIRRQRAKKVLSDSPGLVDFAIGLVNSVFNLPDGLLMFYEEFE